MPIPPNEKNRRGDSRTTNLVINSYWRQFAYDIYYQNYRGFYINVWTELSVHKPARYAQLPDAQVFELRNQCLYFIYRRQLQPERRRLIKPEFQRQSGGTWIANPFYNHLDMYLGKGFVPGSDSSSTPQLPNLSSGRFDTLGTAVGYGYTYVNRAYFATAQGAVNPPDFNLDIERSDDDRSAVYSLAAKLNINCSTGWNYPEYTGGVKLLVDSLWARVQDTQVTSTWSTCRFFLASAF